MSCGGSREHNANAARISEVAAGTPVTVAQARRVFHSLVTDLKAVHASEGPDQQAADPQAWAEAEARRLLEPALSGELPLDAFPHTANRMASVNAEVDPAAMLAAARRDDSEWLRIAASPDTPPAVLTDMIVGVDDPAALRTVAENPSATAEHLNRIVMQSVHRDSHKDTLAAAAVHPNLSDNNLLQLANARCPAILTGDPAWRLTGLSATDSDTLAKICDTPNSDDVLIAATCHRHTPTEALGKIMFYGTPRYSKLVVAATRPLWEARADRYDTYPDAAEYHRTT
jgi:hypothetical protein